jgi:hypothetical protein
MLLETYNKAGDGFMDSSNSHLYCSLGHFHLEAERLILVQCELNLLRNGTEVHSSIMIVCGLFLIKYQCYEFL